MKILIISFMILLTSLANTNALASEDVYQSPEVFITESFGNTQPTKKNLTLTPDVKEKIAKIMGSHYKLSNTTYWQQEGRTVWVLEEIGKFEPITSGFVVGENGKLERVKVLIYRESHGWEVKRKFFTRQFKGAGLKRGKKLDKRIDGIAGATLSVGALKRMGALAAMLHETVRATP